MCAGSIGWCLRAKSPTDPILAKASPVTYITPDDPPFLILHGDMDPVVPYTQSQILHDRLVAGGVSSIFDASCITAGTASTPSAARSDPPYADNRPNDPRLL